MQIIASLLILRTFNLERENLCTCFKSQRCNEYDCKIIFLACLT